jgi:hypothetical protein
MMQTVYGIPVVHMVRERVSKIKNVGTQTKQSTHNRYPEARIYVSQSELKNQCSQKQQHASKQAGTKHNMKHIYLSKNAIHQEQLASVAKLKHARHEHSPLSRHHLVLYTTHKQKHNAKSNRRG